MFIGRKNELAELEKLYHTGKFQHPVIYGRRRVGKTALIREFIKDKDAIFFTGIESNVQQNLENLSRAILAASTPEAPTSAVFQNIQDALEYVFRLSLDRHLVFVIDEYPYLAKSYPAVSSILQRLIDEYKERSTLFLILCGSSMSFMEEQVFGYQSPLYGRRTAQIKLLPFDFFESCQCVPHFSAIDKALAYGMVGGTPPYLLQLDDTETLEDNLKKKLLNPNAYLFEEPGNLLKQEVREAASYNAIISAIATGSSRLSEIANKTHLESSACTSCLNRLLALGLVRKEMPFGEGSTKKTIYAIEDPFFRFWYRFIPSSISILQNGMTDVACKRILTAMPQYMGSVFEEICKQWLWRQNKKEALPFVFTSMGRWWGNDPKQKSEAEIDIVASDEEDCYLFGECKWTNDPVDQAILKKHCERSRLILSARQYYVLFTKSGFTDACRETAMSMGNVQLIGFEDMTS